MQTYLDCYPCFVRQALEAARQLGADEQKQKIVLDRVLELLKGIDLSFTPPQIGDQVHHLVRRELGDSDPYRAFKESATREALALLPRLRKVLGQAEDPLETGVRLSIAGPSPSRISMPCGRVFSVCPRYSIWPTMPGRLSSIGC
jgi:uncharacterized protein with ATP-grasp and redox domains